MITEQQKQHLIISVNRLKRLDFASSTTRKQSEAMQFHTKREASAFASLVGWQKNDAIKIDVMGFKLWAISDPHMNYLTAIGAMEILKRKKLL